MDGCQNDRCSGFSPHWRFWRWERARLCWFCWRERIGLTTSIELVQRFFGPKTAEWVAQARAISRKRRAA